MFSFALIKVQLRTTVQECDANEVAQWYIARFKIITINF